MKTHICYTGCNVIFSSDTEGNVTRLKLLIFTLRKHTFEPTIMPKPPHSLFT